MSVTLVDYGAGNLLNVVRALEYCGITPHVTQSASDIAAAERIIFPGVGAFGDCMKALSELGLAEPIRQYIAQDRPFLGICVGMQVLFSQGEEFGRHPGLGVIAGTVSRIPDVGADGKAHKIPHIGWSTLRRPDGVSWEATPFAALPESRADVYFVHSYRCMPEAKADELAYTLYDGVPITAAVKRGRLLGMQFHPEKSGETGLAILRGFLSQAV